MKPISRFLAFALAFLLLGLSMSVAFAAGDAPVAQTIKGAVRGKVQDGLTCYFGIPFAKTTTGARRFTPPEPADTWTGVLDATKQPKDPIQDSYNALTQSEDSLKLDLWIPPHKDGEPLAVMFWIYGGSYAYGGVGKSYYDLSAMARDTGCILVAANYRLGVCGFLDLRDAVPGATANNGLRDLTLALQWVHENIAFFDGDPQNVTVFGQSAGAALADALLAVPAAAPYFDKVISQSACLDSFYAPAQAKTLANTWLSLMGNPSAKQLASMSPRKLLSRNGLLNVKQTIDAGINCTFNPVIDGEFLTCHPSQLPPKRLQKKLLIGCTKNEAAVFLFFVLWPLTKTRLADKIIMQNFSADLRPALTDGMRFPSTKGFIALTTERMYRYPMTMLADRAAESTEVYAYRYDYQPPAVKLLGLGAFHATEIPVLFDSGLKLGPVTLKITNGQEAKQVGARLRSYWGSFAKTGCPDPAWTPYTAEERATCILDTTDRIEPDPYGARMHLYQDYVSPWKQ